MKTMLMTMAATGMILCFSSLAEAGGVRIGRAHKANGAAKSGVQIGGPIRSLSVVHVDRADGVDKKGFRYDGVNHDLQFGRVERPSGTTRWGLRVR